MVVDVLADVFIGCVCRVSFPEAGAGQLGECMLASGLYKLTDKGSVSLILFPPLQLQDIFLEINKGEISKHNQEVRH